MKSSLSVHPLGSLKLLWLRWTLLLLSFSGALSGQEGNYKFENFGNQSVLLNGNVTGSVRDLGLVYYNPARLGLIDNPSFTIGGKAYEWSKYYFEDILQTEKNLSSNQFGGLPATIAGTFDLKFLPGHKFAYSILSRRRSDIRTKYDSGLTPDPDFEKLPDATESYSEVDFRDRLRDEWFGVSWAYPISETLSVGVSLFGSIYEKNGSGEILINARRESGRVVTYNNRLDFTQKTYGVQIKIGAAWLVSDLEMGVNLSLPFISVKNRSSFSYLESLGGFSPEDDFIVSYAYGELPGKRRTAAGISYGVGIPWKAHKFHLNLDWNAPVGSYDRIEFPEESLEDLGANPFQEEFKSVVNLGVGGEFYVSPSLNIIGSFSTDFSASQASINLFDFINKSPQEINLLNDIWHIALGIDLHRDWGSIIVGTSYARSGRNIGQAEVIPENEDVFPPRNISTQINYERWRFIVGLEIPLLLEKVKDLPIPLR
ncbi:MAG: hypothetical protein ACO20F_10260 [Robiginitalea sp.]|jgi:hypothetical protein